MNYIHLRTHSEFSIVDSVASVKELVERAAAQGMFALALTDDSNLYAAIKFYKAALQAKIKPIIGADVWIKHADNPQLFRTTFLCQNQIGYHNLTELISRAYCEGQQQGRAIIQFDWLEQHYEGLIVLSGAHQGELGQALLHQKQAVSLVLDRWLTWFAARFYIELQRIGHAFEAEYIAKAVAVATEYHLPVVATNPVVFLEREDFTAHEARVCIQENTLLNDPKRVKHYTPQQYFRSAQEMQALFADIPAAFENTIEIAKRCTIEFDLSKNYLPHFPVPQGMTTEAYLVAKSQEGLQQHLAKYPELDRALYEARLDTELNVINAMGFAGYFLIVADFIGWAKKNGIMVGPGRGSGAGSLVAFALGITSLDPLPYDLLFERFLNPERVSMPDFDIDFCMEGRDRVIEYVMNFYGQKNVAQIITYGSMAAKAVVRDVGRVLGYPYGFVDAIAKLIPFELGMTLEKALAQEALLRQRYAEDEEVKTLIDLALKLEGLTRNVGKHAGGVVIAPSKLTDFLPLYCEDNYASIVTQFDKDDVETVGLVKFDFLGLRTLTIIDWSLQAINAKRQKANLPTIDIETIPLNAQPSYDLLKACKTTAVFQLESRGMKDLIRRLQPDCFEDIVALVALYRPGPLQSGMVDDFIARKHGHAESEYLHPLLEPILKPTYGVILYQEQVMQIAQVLAGYTLGGADLLRRAMGKKKPEEMAKQRSTFIKGATERGINEKTAQSIFDLMEKFAGYGFNKSHSAAYALISYQTAWLKAHYPAEFMAAVLSSDMDKTDKVVMFLEEARDLGLKIISPHIHHSLYHFHTNEAGEIMYGLGAIKGVGEGAAEAIVQERQIHGQFHDLFNFAQRVNLRKVNRRTLEALVKSGAMDGLGPHRAVLWETLDQALNWSGVQHQAKDVGQVDLFSEFVEEQTAGTQQFQFVEALPWSNETQLQGEKETLGFYLSGHPLDGLRHELSHIVKARINELAEFMGQCVTISGIVQSAKSKMTKRGDRMAFLRIDDGIGEAEVVVFSDVYEKSRMHLVKDNIIILEVEVSQDLQTEEPRLVAQSVQSFETYVKQRARAILLIFDDEKCNNELPKQLQQILSEFMPGSCVVQAEYRTGDAAVRLKFAEQWRVQPTAKCLTELRNLLGIDRVRLLF